MPDASAIRSTVTADGQLRVELVSEATPELGPDDLLVEVEAAPINPSDLGMLIAGADPASFDNVAGALVGRLPTAAVAANGARLDQPMPCGNEGAGIVVDAGTADAAQALLGKRITGVSGSMYATHTIVSPMMCMEVPDGVTAEQAASSFVNPLTALGMTETMRDEGHTALVHTAAASNLGQMLVKICNDDNIGLVNIVRRQDQADLLRGLGAEHVVDSSADSFHDDLSAALAATGATIAFDATGGGTYVDSILSCMEKALSQGSSFNRYGSDTHKQVYIYGGLQRSATTLNRTYGMSWGVGGWLLTPFLGRIGPERMMGLRGRVSNEITTTFASHYAEQISLNGMLDPDAARAYAAQATGEKRLVCPAR